MNDPNTYLYGYPHNCLIQDWRIIECPTEEVVHLSPLHIILHIKYRDKNGMKISNLSLLCLHRDSVL